MKIRYYKTIHTTRVLLFAKDGRTMTSGGGQRGTVFQEVRPGAGFKTGDFVTEKLGGATVVRLSSRWYGFFQKYVLSSSSEGLAVGPILFDGFYFVFGVTIRRESTRKGRKQSILLAIKKKYMKGHVPYVVGKGGGGSAL